MNKETKRPSAKIYALCIAAILVVGSAVYLKYFSPVSQQDSTLSFQQPASTVPAVDPVTQAMVNDLLKPPSTDNAFSSSQFSPSDNLTDRFSKTAFASYMSLQDAGADDDSAQQGVVDTMVSGATAIQNPDRYTVADIKTFPSTNKADLVDYANKFATIEQTHFDEVKANAQKYKTDSAAFADVYTQIGQDLAALPAPASAASLHLIAANTYINIGQDFKDISNYDADPLKALLAIKNAQDIQSAQASQYTQWQNFWTENGILFTKDDAAYADWGPAASTTPNQ